MNKISIFNLIIRIFTTLLFLIVLSFAYTYLTAINPIVYINIVIWYFMGSILIIPIAILSKNIGYKYFISILISCITIYLVYGMKCSIFMETTLSAVLSDGKMWLPKVNFNDLISTISSISEYKFKLNFLSEYDTLNLSYKGRKGIDTGAGFTNFFRIIECIGFLILPIYVNLKNKKENP